MYRIFSMSLRLMSIALGVSCLVSFPSIARAELLLWYDFNDASKPAQATDLSGKNNHGELLGDPDPAIFSPDSGGRTGKLGDRALDFGVDEDGDPDGNNSDLDGRFLEVMTAAGGAFGSIVEKDAATISVWAFGGELQPQNHFIFWFADGDGDPRQLASHAPWSNGQIYFDAAGCCAVNQRISAPLDPAIFQGTWSHYAFVKDGETTAIYVNGELFLDSGENVIDPLLDITTVRFGSGQDPGKWGYNGLMDDIGVWNEALSETRIQDLANGKSPIGGGGVKGDFDGDGDLDAADIDALSAAVRVSSNDSKFDVNMSGKVDNGDRGTWVRDLKKTYFGDANLDLEFNSSDFVSVFTKGEYEDNTAGNSTWADGDWNGDTEFTSGDFVTAFQDGGFEKGPRAASSVPEPGSIVLLLFAVGVIGVRSRPFRLEERN